MKDVIRIVVLGLVLAAPSIGDAQRRPPSPRDDAGANRDAGSAPDAAPPTQPLRPLADAPGTRTLVVGDYQIWVQGALRERMVAEVADARRRELLQCHRLEREVDGDAAPEARVMVRVRVRPDGTVENAFIYPGHESLDSAAAVRCVQDTIRQWRFAARRQPSVIDYAFVLRAGTTDVMERGAGRPQMPGSAPTVAASVAEGSDLDLQTTPEPARPGAGNVRVTGEVRVAFGDAQVQGGLFADDAHRLVRARLGDLRVCYDRALAEQPDLGGRMTLAMIVGPNGSVARAAVQGSTVGHSGVEQCFTDIARRWRFPPSRAGESASIRYPIELAATVR